MIYEEPPQPMPPQTLRLPLAPVRALYPLIAINILAFIPYLGTLFNQDAVWRFILTMGGLIPAAVLDYHQLWRLVTAGFLHLDILHIGFNMYALNILGKNAEALFGTRRFLSGYLLSLLSSSILVTAFAGRETLTIGASGAIMGIVGLLLAYSYRYRDAPAVHAMFSSLVQMTLLNLGIGLLPGISLWGHLGGLLGGIAAGWALCPRYVLSAGNEWTPAHVAIEPWGARETARLRGIIAALLAIVAVMLWVG